jgi:hypothetical protein
MQEESEMGAVGMPEPLIILAPPRSFTSVVCAMLGQHPQMYGLPEVHLFAAETIGELFHFYRIAGRRRQHGLLRVIAELYMGQQTVQTIELARLWLWRHMDVETGSLFKRLIARVAPRIIVEKSVSTIWRPENLERLGKTFPNARFIHLTRHPRPQCESMLEAAKHERPLARQMLDDSTEPPTIDPQILWYKHNSNIMRFLAAVPVERRLHVRGEDLLHDPDTSLRQIAAWLGLQTDAAAIEAMKHPERSPFAVVGPINALFGNDPKFLKDPVLRLSRAQPQSLQGPLSWRGDVDGFLPEVTELAMEFAYT